MDVLDIKVRNNKDLIKLSVKSHQCLLRFVKDFKRYEEFIQSYKKLFQTVWVDNYLKVLIILNSLNVDQKNAFLDISNNLSNANGSISSIDAGPGTGKTFLTACLLMSYKNVSTYMVYTNKLSELMNGIFFDGVSTTCCKFLMRVLKVNYLVVKYMWNLKDCKTLEEKCQELEILAKSCKPLSKLYIVDENSVMSPFFIYFMYCLYKYHKIHLIFIGDQYQQLPINSTKYHRESNFEILKIVSNVYKLNINIRQHKDVYFINILQTFLQQFTNLTDKKMTFHIKFIIYEKLFSKFHTADNFEAMFFAQHHLVLKNRLLKYEKHLLNAHVPFTRAYIRCKKNDGIVNDENIRKFRSYIILVIGTIYIYSPNTLISNPVMLKEIQSKHLKVFCITTQRFLYIKRVPVNIHFISEQLLSELNQKYSSCVQFPLRELVSTYHAAQGLTIANDKIELDLDCQYISSFYVGLTRIQELSQLSKIHSNDLLNLTYTKKQNDEFYYKINNYVKPLTFITCNNTHTFETLKKNVKIKRLCYNLQNIIKEDTELMKYIKTVL